MTTPLSILVILIGIGSFCAPTAWAKTCDVAVSVEDFVTKAAVEGAVVEVKGRDSDISRPAKEIRGRYLSGDLAEGLYSITVEKDGYKSSTKRIVNVCNKSVDSKTFETSIYLVAGSRKDRVHVIDKDLTEVLTAKVGMNDLALELPKPRFPVAGRGRSSTVLVSLLINEDGTVKAAHGVAGDSALWESAEEAALKARFVPSVLNGKPTKVTATITYSFVP